jgi:hypothetical protein
MKNPFDRTPDPLELERISIIDSLRGMTMDDPLYEEHYKYLEKIQKLSPNKRELLDPNQVLAAFVSGASVAAIIAAERGGAFFGTKALGFIPKIIFRR